MFNNCTKLTNLNLRNFNTDNIKNMSYMFYNCNDLFNLDIINFRRSRIWNCFCGYCKSISYLN